MTSSLSSFFREFEPDSKGVAATARLPSIHASESTVALSVEVVREGAVRSRFELLASDVSSFVFRSGHGQLGDDAQSVASEGVPRLVTAHPLLWRFHERIFRVRAPAQSIPEKAALSVMVRHQGLAQELPAPWLSLADLLMRLRQGEPVGEVPESQARAYMDALTDAGIASELSDVFWSERPANPDAKLLSFEHSHVIANSFSVERKD